MKENKINIAELLKDCPKGMELDCLLYDNVTFISVDDEEHTIFPIKVRRSDGCKITLTEYGQYAHMDDAKCIIFPKGKTTWEGFHKPFKDGDIAISNRGDIHLLRTEDSSYCAYRKYAWRSTYEFDSTRTTMVKVVRLATEEEKKKLFDAIKENGYKWNPETKTLEKLIEPKFKVGDKVRHKTNHSVVFTIDGIEEDFYTCTGKMALCFSEQDSYELVPNKFDITTLKTFESRVLVRNADEDLWKPAVFGCYIDKDAPYYVLGGICWRYCIPYEDNEHLRGTTDDCDEYFKTWKK